MRAPIRRFPRAGTYLCKKQDLKSMPIQSAMTTMGQKQTSVQHNRMSALPPKADIRDAHHHVCLGHYGTSAILAVCDAMRQVD